MIQLFWQRFKLLKKIKIGNTMTNIQNAVIASKILSLRNEKVILDIHLAELYNVETRVLKQAVRRNTDRFPDDFMFELTDYEIEYVVSQNVIPSKRHFGGAIPFAFTENGVAMLSSVLSSKQAIIVNIAIMRTFTMIRRMMLAHIDIMREVELIRNEMAVHDSKLMQIFPYFPVRRQASPSLNICFQAVVACFIF